MYIVSVAAWMFAIYFLVFGFAKHSILGIVAAAVFFGIPFIVVAVQWVQLRKR